MLFRPTVRRSAEAELMASHLYPRWRQARAHHLLNRPRVSPFTSRPRPQTRTPPVTSKAAPPVAMMEGPTVPSGKPGAWRTDAPTRWSGKPIHLEEKAIIR